MSLSFVYPRDASSFYNGNALANLYAETIGSNHGHAFTISNQDATAPFANYSNFITFNQGAIGLSSQLLCCC